MKWELILLSIAVVLIIIVNISQDVMAARLRRERFGKKVSK